MDDRSTIPFSGKDGLRGVVVSLADSGHSQAEVLLEDGRRVLVPAGLLQRRQDGSLYLPLSLSDLGADGVAGAGGGGNAADRLPLVIPLAEERLEADVRRVVTGTVRVATHVTEREEVADLPLVREEVEVERVAVGRVVDAPVPVRREGDTLVVPVMEEVLVVEKRLVLREEVRLTTRRSEAHQPQRVTLRREEATVERLGGDQRRPGHQE
jgi:uncharacterized protein (TIGR02271 family)